MLPSCENAKPHRTAACQELSIPARGDGPEVTRERLQRLRYAIVNYDHTHIGILPASTVTQFAKLHGVWPGVGPWQQLLNRYEPPGMPRRVEYMKLLQALAR